MISLQIIKAIESMNQWTSHVMTSWVEYHINRCFHFILFLHKKSGDIGNQDPAEGRSDHGGTDGFHQGRPLPGAATLATAWPGILITIASPRLSPCGTSSRGRSCAASSALFSSTTSCLRSPLNVQHCIDFMSSEMK